MRLQGNQVLWEMNCGWSTRVGYTMHCCVTVGHRYVAVGHFWPTWCQMHRRGNIFLDDSSIKAHAEQILYRCCSSDLQYSKEPIAHYWLKAGCLNIIKVLL